MIGLCVCRYESDANPSSAAWHEGHRVHHLQTFPRVDDRTRAALDTLIDIHRKRETHHATDD